MTQVQPLLNTGQASPCGQTDTEGNIAFFNQICLPNGPLTYPSTVIALSMYTNTITIPQNVLTDVTFANGIITRSNPYISFNPPALNCTLLQTAFYRLTAFVDWGNDILTGTYRMAGVFRSGNQLLNPTIGLPPVTSAGVDTCYSWSIPAQQNAGVTLGLRLLHDATAPLTRVFCNLTIEVVGI